jgi:hypothetical protein
MPTTPDPEMLSGQTATSSRRAAHSGFQIESRQSRASLFTCSNFQSSVRALLSSGLRKSIPDTVVGLQRLLLLEYLPVT